jgi:hypothetical protein
MAPIEVSVFCSCVANEVDGRVDVVVEVSEEFPQALSTVTASTIPDAAINRRTLHLPPDETETT